MRCLITIREARPNTRVILLAISSGRVFMKNKIFPRELEPFLQFLKDRHQANGFNAQGRNRTHDEYSPGLDPAHPCPPPTPATRVKRWGRFRAQRAHLKTFKDLDLKFKDLDQIQGQNLAVTVFNVPYSLDSSCAESHCACNTSR